MKKCISFLLATVLLLLCVCIVPPEVYAATKPEKTRAIAIVFDNSGTMYIGDNDSKKTWCRATYAMQALATMMNPSDTMQIYPMNPIQIGNADNPPESDVYTRERPLVITKESASLIQEICTPKALDTHIEAVTLAREGLANTTADEKWLIVLTDGTVFYRNGKELSKQESIRQLTEEFNTAVSQVNAMYLGIGKEAQNGFAVSGNYQFVERKATNSAQVLENLTELGNIIFGRDELPSASEAIKFDVSMKKLIVFIQGESIDNVALSGATPVSTNKLQYSTHGAKNYTCVNDTSLQGTMLTFENLSAGSYQISFTGQASDIAVYYEPDADLDFVFTDSEGNLVEPESLYEGDYKVSFGMKDAKTGQLVSSSLLGKPHYEGTYSINGETKKFTYDGSSGEVPIALKMNDSFDANLTVTYLSGYTISKTSSDFGWPEGGIKVAARPAGDLKLKISGGDKVYSLQDLTKGKAYTAEVYYKGEKLVGEELKKVQLKWNPETSYAEIKQEFAEDHYNLTLHYKDPKAPANTVCGKCKVVIYANYAAQGSDEAESQATLSYHIKDDFIPVKTKLYATQDYIVISELDKSDVFTVKLTMNNKPLKAEDFKAVSLAVDCGGINYKATPNEKDSSYTIKLLKTDGLEEKDYNITVTTTYTDHIGRETQSDDSILLTLSNTPLWLKWLLIILIILALILIAWRIAHIKAMPSAKVLHNVNASSLTVGGKTIEPPSLFAKRNGKTLEFRMNYDSSNYIVRISNVKPGDKSFISTPQSKRSFKINPAGVTKIGEINHISIGGKDFELDKKTGQLVIDGLVPFNLRNNNSVSFSGKIEDGGKTRPFHAEIPLIFKKK